ncbi:MAG: YfhO family protein [Solobacterium sp.]|nr:YfhO family protein [Solobacterium sp.]
MKRNPERPVLWLFVLTTLVCAFIFVPYLHGETAFVLGWDMRTLYSSNFESLRTQMQEWMSTGKLPFWSWSTFLGNDYYSSKLFYFQDLFDYPFAFTSMRYRDIAVIQTYLKFLTASFSFYAYARYQRFSRRTSILGSLMFAFSAYNLQTMMHPFFGSFFVFLPLYFLGVDRYIVEKKPWLFVFMVFFLFVNNYYLLYSLSLFTIIYFIWRWNRLYHDLQGMMKEAVKLIGYYMIGFLLSGVVVVPEVITILSNSRVGNRSTILFYDSLKPYLDYLVAVFTPTSALANRETVLASLYSYTSANNSVMAVFLWSSSLTALLVPQLFRKERRDKIEGILWGVITAVALIPILSSVMHGFSEPSFRWLASPSFLLVVSVLPLLDHNSTLNMPWLKRTVLFLVLASVICTPVISLVTTHSLAYLSEEWYLPLMCIPTMILIGYGLIHNRQNIVLWSVIAELCLVSFMSFYGTPEFTGITKEEDDLLSRLMGEKNEYNLYMEAVDEDNTHQFWRTYIDPLNVYWGRSTNYNLNYNIRGFLSYDSTYHYSANDLKALDQEHVQHYLPWTFHVQNPDILNLCSAKYAVVLDESEVPFKNYEFVTNYYVTSVYRNLDYVNLGKTYTKVISYDEYTPSMSGILEDTVIAHAEDVEEIRGLMGNSVTVFDTAYPETNSMYAEIYTGEAGFAVISVPYDKGWHVSVNDQEVKSYMVSGGLTGIPLVSGYNYIYMSFTPRGLKPGAICTLAGLILMVIVMIINKKKKSS